MIAADEVVAVTSTVKFRYDDGTTFLSWVVGDNVSPAVWISVFLILVTIVNMLPVKVSIDLRFIGISGPYLAFTSADVGLQYFGELEYVFGSIKLTFITMLIVMMVILDTMKRRYQIMTLPHVRP